MHVSRGFVIAYMALVSILCAALLAPMLLGVILSPDPPDESEGGIVAMWFGLIGGLWVIGMVAGVLTLRGRSRN
jgi:hypothetical protein